MTETRSYPRHINTDAGTIEFRLMSRADEAAVLEFARALPTHDLLFLPRDARAAGIGEFSNPILQFDYTLMVAAGSAIATIADADRPGVRIAAHRRNLIPARAAALDGPARVDLFVAMAEAVQTSVARVAADQGLGEIQRRAGDRLVGVLIRDLADDPGRRGS